jgi:hypothetical protein
MVPCVLRLSTIWRIRLGPGFVPKSGNFSPIYGLARSKVQNKNPPLMVVGTKKHQTYRLRLKLANPLAQPLSMAITATFCGQTLQNLDVNVQPLPSVYSNT